MWHFCHMGGVNSATWLFVLCIPMWHFCYITLGMAISTRHRDELGVYGPSRIADFHRNLVNKDVAIPSLLTLDSDELGALKLSQPARNRVSGGACGVLKKLL